MYDNRNIILYLDAYINLNPTLSTPLPNHTIPSLPLTHLIVQVINGGDYLRMVSNERYLSPIHRVNCPKQVISSYKEQVHPILPRARDTSVKDMDNVSNLYFYLI